METKDIKIGLVIMASGLGKRFGGDKLMEMLNGKPLIRWIIDATNNHFDKRIVVTRNTKVKAMCDELKIDCIIHELPNRNDTVRLGLTALMQDVDYCFFTPGDQPLISKESIDLLVSEAKIYKEKIIRAGFEDVTGSPVGFPKTCFDDLLKLPEGKGGNFIAKNNPQMVHSVNVKEEYELWDIDTVSDLEKIKNVLKTE